MTRGKEKCISWPEPQKINGFFITSDESLTMHGDLRKRFWNLMEGQGKKKISPNTSHPMNMF
jgi:hypothetical protein